MTWLTPLQIGHVRCRGNAERRIVDLIDPLYEIPIRFMDAVPDMSEFIQPESDVMALGEERGLMERLFELLDGGLLQGGGGVLGVEE